MKRKRNNNYGNKKFLWKKRRKDQIEIIESTLDDNQQEMYEDSEDDNIQQLTALLPIVIEEMSRLGFLPYLIMFFNLIVKQKFDFTNICFLLFCDNLRFWSTTTTTMMRYPFKDTRRFWHVGKILFHGRFQRFMTGYKHTGQMIDSSRGHYLPENGLINFAVPSHIHLETVEKNFPSAAIKGPGKFEFMVKNIIETNPVNSFVLTFDGKKLAPGLTSDSGDVDLLGYDEPPLKAKQNQFETTCNSIMKLYNSLKSFDDCFLSQVTGEKDLIDSIKYVSFQLSQATKDMRTLISKQRYALDKFEEKALKETGKNYSYVIDAIKTSIYRAKAVIADALKAHDCILYAMSILNKSDEYVTGTGRVNVSNSTSFFTLQTPNIVQDLILDGQKIPTHLIKQRTEKWHDIRRAFRVTGSKAHRALGLDGLKNQKQTFLEVMEKQQAPEPNDTQRKAMEHGSENEINALATLHSKVLPTYFPGLSYYEEGIRTINNEFQEIIAVSPDGSVRASKQNTATSEKIMYAVECKCPMPAYKYNTPVYYKIPERYVCQTMLEMRSLGCDECIFICWSDESSTVFKIRLNQRLIALILNETQDVYYGENNNPPTRLSWRTKEMKELCKDISENSKFIGEFPSLHGCVTGDVVCTDGPYTVGDKVNNKSDMRVEELLQAVLLSHKTCQEVYQLNRKKASEIIPILLSSFDRTCNAETGHAIPIGYFLRGYSLSTDVMRKIADDFMQICHQNGLHIPVQSFDGQWINLVTRDENGNPLTKLQLRKDVWKEAKSHSKQDIVRHLKTLNKTYNAKTLFVAGYEQIFKVLSVTQSTTECIPSTNVKQLKQQTSQKLNTIENENDIIESSVIDQIAEIVSDNVANNESIVVPEVESSLVDQQNSLVDVQSILQDQQISLVDLQNPGEYTVDADDTNYEVPVTETEARTSLSDENIADILLTLKSSKRSEFWKSKQISDFKEIIKTPAEIEKLRDYELKAIFKVLKTLPNSHNLRLSSSKADKMSQLDEFLNGEVSTRKTKSKLRSAVSLKDLCCRILLKKDYPKDVLASAYAQNTYPLRLKYWTKNSHVDDKVLVEGLETSEDTVATYYYPEYIKKRNQLEIKVIDGTHVRNNIRAALCKDKIEGIRKEAWIQVAKSKKSPLKLSLLEVQQDGKLLDQQKEEYTRLMFCEQVQNTMKSFVENGTEIYLEEVIFCELVRNWIRAEDEQGLDACERISYSLKLREWMLKDVHFDIFPPQSQYIKGIPIVTFESIVCNIDAHIYLYNLALSKTYHWRAVSSLVAETFMSDIDYMDNWARNGVLTAHGAMMHMKTVCALHSIQHDPDRSFHMRITAATPVYSVRPAESQNDEEEIQEVQTEPDKFITAITPRNHRFDNEKRMETAFFESKIGRLSNPDEPARGTQPIRAYYKIDESKVMHSKRLGIDISELSNG